LYARFKGESGGGTDVDFSGIINDIRARSTGPNS